jgi:hypothetical protein
MTRVEPEPGYFESLARLKKKRSRGWENSIKNKVPSPPKEDRKLKDEGLGRENKNVGGGSRYILFPSQCRDRQRR